MNNIQEMDWAADCWHGHTGMDSSSEYCTPEQAADKTCPTPPATKEPGDDGAGHRQP